MATTMDAAGRLVIPREVRRRAGIEPGTELAVRWNEDHIGIHPRCRPVKLEKRGCLVVAVPEHEPPLLTSDTVEDTRQALSAERA